MPGLRRRLADDLCRGSAAGLRMIFAGASERLRKLAEQLFDDLLTVAKNFIQSTTDDKGIGQVAEKSKRYGVMYLVGHFYPPFYSPEMMLVMPKAIRAAALFVDKRMSRFYLRDLGKPVRPQPWQGPQFVFDALSGINAIALCSGQHDEFHIGWGDEGKICRIGEKRPDFKQGSWDELDAM